MQLINTLGKKTSYKAEAWVHYKKLPLKLRQTIYNRAKHEAGPGGVIDVLRVYARDYLSFSTVRLTNSTHLLLTSKKIYYISRI